MCKLSILTMLLFTSLIFSQDYYYFFEEKIPLLERADSYVIHFASGTQMEDKEKILSENNFICDSDLLVSNKVIVSTRSLSELEVRELSDSQFVKSITKLYTLSGHPYLDFTFDDQIIVKVKKEVSDGDINDLISELSLTSLNRKWLGERTYLFLVDENQKSSEKYTLCLSGDIIFIWLCKTASYGF